MAEPVLCDALVVLPGGRIDPSHQHTDGTWWFWEETWADEQGPFKTYIECAEACREYARRL